MRLSTLLLSLLSVFAATSSVIPEDVETFRLSNGIQVVTRTLDNNEVEGFSLFLAGGSSVLAEDTQGLEALALESAMMGSESVPGPEWRELMDRTQAEWSGSYNYDYSRYHLRCLREDLPTLLEAFAGCLLEPELDPEAFERVRGIRTGIVMERDADPDQMVWHVANQAFMRGHPYSLLPAGTRETLERFTIGDVREWLDERIRSGNILLVHAGPTSPAELREMLESSFGRLPEGGGVPVAVPGFGLERDEIVLRHADVQTAFAVVKTPAPPAGHPDLPVYEAAMDVLSEMLWQVLRTESALTYATWSGSTGYRQNWGYLYVSSPRPLQACSLMAEVYAAAALDGLDPELVRGTIRTGLTRHHLWSSGKEAQCGLLGRYQLATGDWRNAFLYFDRMAALESDSLSAVLEKWSGPAAWGIIMDTTGQAAASLEPWPLTPSEGRTDQ